MPGNGKLIAADWAPDGKHIAGYTPEGRRRPVSLYELETDGALVVVKTGLGEATGERISPDGTRILLSGRNDGHSRKLGVLDMVTGSERTIPWEDREYREPHWATWAPDGRKAAFHALNTGGRWEQDRAIFLVPLDDPADARQLTHDGASNLSPRVSPDGLNVTYFREGKPGLVKLVPADGSNEPMQLAPGEVPAWAPDGRRVSYETPKGIMVAYLGGLDPRPIRIHTEGKGATLGVVVTAQEKRTQTVTLRWEAYDEQSVRLGPATESSEPVELKPSERVEWPISLTDEQAESAVTVKVTVLNQDGVGAVKLVDWAEQAK